MSRYCKWIESLFERDENNGDWRWDIGSEPLELSSHDSVEYFIQLMHDLPELVEEYSTWQISLGLEYLFNGSMSNFIFAIREGTSAIERRIEAILEIKNIYRFVFEPMCESKLGHLSEKGNELNGFCYMFWDTTPLGYCKSNTYELELYAAISDVMEYAIQSDNIACIESGLHGVGEIVRCYPQCAEIVRKR